jgi:hypothetical protein
VKKRPLLSDRPTPSKKPGLAAPKRAFGSDSRFSRSPTMVKPVFSSQPLQGRAVVAPAARTPGRASRRSSSRVWKPVRAGGRRIARRGQEYVERHGAARLETGIGPNERGEAAREKAGGDQQRARQRDLRHDDDAAPTERARARGAAIALGMERAPQVAGAALHGWSEAEEERHETAEREREHEHAEVEPHGVEARKVRGQQPQ